ncbi:hypothetical protein ACWKW4_01755 [Hydrogenophaga borbori]
MTSIPSKGSLLKDAATAEISNHITRGLEALEAGDDLGAGQAFSQAVAVSAVYALVTAWSMAAYYPVSGLSHALRHLSQSPSMGARLIRRTGLVVDPLVISRMENVLQSFAGGAAAAWVTSKAIDWFNELSVGGLIYDWANPDPLTNTAFNSARSFINRRDPLVLDLDGDGLELSAASGSVLFDHNADGIKTGTGWARPDDGFLVRDLNGNGSIDSGRELFGVDTVKSNGQLASQGFDALADLDSNGDGQITSADAAWGQLQVWRDTNQDGISQAGELSGLDALGITRLGLNGSATGPQAGQTINNNRVALSTTFTRNGVNRTVGAIDLEANAFFSEIPPQVVDEAGQPVVVTQAASALPQMNGSGMARNLRAAMSLPGTQADELEASSRNWSYDKIAANDMLVKYVSRTI